MRIDYLKYEWDEVDIVTLKLLLIFAPGLIGMTIYNHLVCKAKQSFEYFIVYSILFGIVSYASVNILVNAINLIIKYFPKKTIPVFDFSQFFNIIKSSQSDFSISLLHFWLTCVTAVLLSLFFTVFINKCWLYKVLNFLKVSNRDSAFQVWNKIFGDETNDNWVMVIDYKNNKIYDGRLYHHSDYSEENEMFLKGVIIYDLSTKKELERCNGLYISRADKETTLIVPKADASDDFLDRECYYSDENDIEEKRGVFTTWLKKIKKIFKV